MQHHNINRRQGGFTLIELLITVAIIAILAIIGATAYASFGAKAQVAEAFNQLEGVKHAYMIRYNEDGGERGDYQLADLDSTWAPDHFAGQYVESVNLVNGMVQVNFKPAPATDGPLAGTSFIMLPYETAGKALVWRCANAAAPSTGGATPTPLNVAGTAGGNGAAGPYAAGNSTTPASLLPKNCRA